MFLQSASTATAIPPPVLFGCSLPLIPRRKHRNHGHRPGTIEPFRCPTELIGNFRQNIGLWRLAACMVANNKGKTRLNVELMDVTNKSARTFSIPKVLKKTDIRPQEDEFSSSLSETEIIPQTSLGRKRVLDSKQVTLSFTTAIQDDHFVYRLRNQLGNLHGLTITSLPLAPVVSLFGFFFLVGVVFDKIWTSRKTNKQVVEIQSDIRPQVPTSLYQFLEKDLRRKESVEWVNMVLSKLWKVYRLGLENWLVGLLQPIIDDLKKPAYVQRVEIKQFYLGEEPISVRSVERRTSRRANDLQYHIGLRYTGGARMLLMLSLKFGFMPIMIPVGVRDLDVDGELWVKLRLIPSVPWVGTATWAFVSLPKIKLDLAPFRLFNLMAIPVLSMFLTKLLTEDLPRLFVRPNKIVLDFQKGQAVGPISKDLKNGVIQEGNKDYAGELSVTLVDARKLDYVLYGKTDPYIVLSLGDQEIRSKKNSQTTVIGPPGAPIWNQDFQLLVVDPQKQKLGVKVRDSFGLGIYTVGMGEVELGTLQDTVPTDRIVTLKGSWGLLRKRFAGEVLLRITYKAYVDDEEDDGTQYIPLEDDVSDDETLSAEEKNRTATSINNGISNGAEEELFMDKLVELLVSEEFQGIVASEAENTKNSEDTNASQSLDPKSEGENQTTQSVDNKMDQEGSVIIWLGLITGIAVLVAISLDGSNFFNP